MDYRTGEKDFEEFFTENETLDMESFNNLGVIKNELISEDKKLEFFTKGIEKLKSAKSWTKQDILTLFYTMIPDFGHKETGKYLDSKM